MKEQKCQNLKFGVTIFFEVQVDTAKKLQGIIILLGGAGT